ncbi:MAG: cupredoxin domain-containing protein [Acidobacteria bacterium]|nr:cupredoxin domain-containing protein [Acidobacteriota bacterium]
MKDKILLFLIGLLLCCLTMATSEGMSSPEVSAQSNNQITITNYKFEPKKLTVAEGTTITWDNKEGVHIVKSDSDAFASKTMKPGEKFTYQFTKAGAYPYHCTFHGSKGGNEMAGTIVVVKKK